MSRIGRPIGSGLAVALAAVVLVACGSNGRGRATDGVGTSRPDAVATSVTPSTAGPTSTAAATTSSAAATTTADPPTPPPSTAPPSTVAPSTIAPPAVPAVSVSLVTAAQLGGSWHTGCPVGPSQLRRLTLPYWGFDGQPHHGQLVVAVAAVAAVSTVFRQLYQQRFPIRKMVTIDHYAGTGVQLDDESTADDNTAAFNCRNAVDPGGAPAWSEHAYGEAVDVNPVENPYVESDGVVDPPNGAAYVNRGVHHLGMAYVGSPLNAAFASVGWAWGGAWSGHPDYQHFSENGQ